MERPEYNRLKVVLAEQKKTNRWLAEALGKDESSVSKWVRNVQQPEIKTLFKIAELLGVDVCALLHRKAPNTPSADWDTRNK